MSYRMMLLIATCSIAIINVSLHWSWPQEDSSEALTGPSSLEELQEEQMIEELEEIPDGNDSGDAVLVLHPIDIANSTSTYVEEMKVKSLAASSVRVQRLLGSTHWKEHAWWSAIQQNDSTVVPRELRDKAVNLYTSKGQRIRNRPRVAFYHPITQPSPLMWSTGLNSSSLGEIFEGFFQKFWFPKRSEMTESLYPESSTHGSLEAEWRRYSVNFRNSTLTSSVVDTALNLIQSWEVAAENNTLDVDELEFAGPEGYCVQPAKHELELSDQQLRCLVAMDVEDTYNVSLQEGGISKCWEPNFIRGGRWMFRNFAPPLSLVDPNTCVAYSASDSLVIRSRIERRRKKRPNPITGKKSPYRDNRALEHFVLHNVCFNPNGFGFSAMFDFATVRNSFWQYVLNEKEEGLVRLRGIRSEYGARIKSFHIKQRITRPKCFYTKPLMVHPVLHPAQNFGHVVYRAAMINDVATSNFTTLFLVLPDALHFNSLHDSVYRVFSNLLVGNQWLSMQELENVTNTVSTEAQDLCFRTVIFGWRVMSMYHRQRKRAKIFEMALTRVIPALRRFKRKLYSCFVPHAVDEPRLRSGVNESNPIIITVVQRARRRILNLDDMVTLFALDVALATNQSVRVPSVRIRVVDFSLLSPNVQAVVAQETDIMIGPHGAGNAWMIMMRPRGVFVELRDYLHLRGGVQFHSINIKERILVENGQTSFAAGLHYVSARIRRSDVKCQSLSNKFKHSCDLKPSPEIFSRVLRVAISMWMTNTDTPAVRTVSV